MGWWLSRGAASECWLFFDDVFRATLQAKNNPRFSIFFSEGWSKPAAWEPGRSKWVARVGLGWMLLI